MRDVTLQINGVKYGGWKDIRITRTREAFADSFQLQVSERWSDNDNPWPIIEGDRCEVWIGSEPIITGFVDRCEMSYSANDHTFSVVGRSKAAQLIDASAVLDAWEFNGLTALQIAERVAKPFGVKVSSELIAMGRPPRKVVINPGDTAYDVIDRACRLSGLFAMSQPDGNLTLYVASAGSFDEATPLVEGQNILTATATHDASSCYRKYIVIGQQQGDDDTHGKAAAEVRAEAEDLNCRNTARVLMIQAEGSVNIDYAQRRANWEASIRRARALELNVTVQGWEQGAVRDAPEAIALRQGERALWPVGALVQVRAPYLGVERLMQISQATYSLSASTGTTTELTLRVPEAFLPEPQIQERARKRSGSDKLQESTRGA